MLVSDELLRRQDRLLERRHKQARFRDPDRSLDGFHVVAAGRDRRVDEHAAGPEPLHQAVVDPPGVPGNRRRRKAGQLRLSEKSCFG